MGMPWWFMGILLSLSASLFGTLGKVLMKLSHNSGENRMIFGAAVLCVIILNPTFDALSYAYAAQSVLAPMAGFSVVWNIVLSPLVLNEKVYIQDVIGTAMIMSGCIIVGLTGSHTTPHHTREQLFYLFSQPIFIGYLICLLSICTFLTWLICVLDRASSWRRFSFGALSGIIGGNLFFLKATVELFEAGSEVWSYSETYWILISALITAAGGIYVLNAGLKEYEALYLVAVYQTFLIVIGSLSGILFFHEDSDMSVVELLIYPVGIIVTTFGILTLSTKIVIGGAEAQPLLLPFSKMPVYYDEACQTEGGEIV